MVTREQHLNSLSEVPGLQTVVKQSRWKVQLQPPSRHICTIWVDLPNNFPSDAPVVTLYPNIDHHWVNVVNGSARVVGHSHVRPWTNNYLLGQLIIDVIQEISGVRFQATPQQIPKNLQSQSSGLTRDAIRAQDAQHQQQKQLDASAATAKMTRGGSRNIDQSATNTPQMPVIPTNFPDLEKLSAEELEELQEDPDALQEFVENLEMASSYRSMQEELQTNNEALARKTLTKKEKADALHEQMAETSGAQKSAAEEAERVSAEQMKILEKYSRQHLIDTLRAQEIESNTDAKAISTQLVDQGPGDSNLKELLEMYVKHSKSKHRLRSKQEKLSANSN